VVPLVPVVPIVPVVPDVTVAPTVVVPLVPTVLPPLAVLLVPVVPLEPPAPPLPEPSLVVAPPQPGAMAPASVATVIKKGGRRGRFLLIHSLSKVASTLASRAGSMKASGGPPSGAHRHAPLSAPPSSVTTIRHVPVQ
jgi:hypothetical protein